jgi:hypothetical protein
MISSNIFYLTFLSVSCMSFVRAPLTPQQTIEIGTFWNSELADLHDALQAVPQSTLDAYFSDCILIFQNTLGPYLDNLHETVRNGKKKAPSPGEQLARALAGLPNLVYLIKYSNVCILNDLKWKFLSIYPESIDSESILGIINDENVSDLWNDYVTYRTSLARRPLESYVLYIALLFSMNRTMLDLTPQIQCLEARLVQRLANYQTMIIWLHTEMARYMRIKTLRPYSKTFLDFKVKLDELATEVMTEEDRTAKIRDHAVNLSHAILPMIAIYGRPAARPATPAIPGDPITPGTEVIFNLFRTRWTVQRLIGQNVNPNVSRPRWIRVLLNTLALELEEIENRSGAWSSWMVTIRPILNIGYFLLRPSRKRPGTSGTK